MWRFSPQKGEFCNKKLIHECNDLLGGIKAAGFIWSPLLANSSRISSQLMQIADWLPTLYHAAGGDPADITAKLDGTDLWEELSQPSQTESKRKEILHNIDNIWGSSSLLINEWKLVVGTNYEGQWDSWYGPSGDRNPEAYPLSDLLTCKTAQALEELNMMPNPEHIK